MQFRTQSARVYKRDLTMTMDDFRKRMESYRASANEEATSLKDSYLALERLHRLYRIFDTKEREMADQVLTEWVLSEDENVRFDALALIRDFKIRKATQALQELADRLAHSSTKGALYELKKVNRILKDFGA